MLGFICLNMLCELNIAHLAPIETLSIKLFVTILMLAFALHIHSMEVSFTRRRMQRMRKRFVQGRN